MATPPVCDFDWPAPAFSLPDPDGRMYSLSDLAGKNGTLVMFICNHCPYVKSVAGKIASAGRVLADHGIGTVAICANDARNYPDDAPPKMAAFARAHGFGFPYLVDESQDVARAYGAECTPDFFGFNAGLGLQYRGRLDESGARNLPDARQELVDAMIRIAATGKGPADQVPSMGCSIKWKQG